jgi:hypothetical protein
LPTIVFAIENGFSITSFARWHQQAQDAYQDLRDDFWINNLSVEKGFELKKKLDEELRVKEPTLQPLHGRHSQSAS